MQYLQPAERLATCAIRRLSLRSTLPNGSQIAALICVKACTILGLRCMISTLFGMNPMRLRAASNCSFSSGVCSGGNGARRGAGLVLWSILSSSRIDGRSRFASNRLGHRASGFAAGGHLALHGDIDAAQELVERRGGPPLAFPRPPNKPG